MRLRIQERNRYGSIKSLFTTKFN